VHRNRLRDRAIQLAIRVSLLFGAILCAAPVFAGGSSARLPYGSFVAADLDGDRQPDFATAGANRREGAGYLLDIAVRLSGVDSGVITVRTSQAAGRLSARDLDGDTDRDLILESFDREPLAVLLNDGGGHFHQVDLDDYRARLRKPGRQSIDAPASDSDSCSVNPADAPAPARSQPHTASARSLRPHDERIAAPAFSNRASRAPPALL
jgi:hypothetical protein